MKNKNKIWCTGLSWIAAITMMLSGCSVAETLTPVRKEEKEYGKAETMVILSTERLRYEDVYTEELWSAAVDQDGTTFETVLLSQVHDFLIELKTMSNMAKEQKIELTSREKELVKEASENYFEALGSSRAAEFELTKEQVSALYTDYWTAEKLVEQLTESMNLEVSDSEAKVIEVAQIEVSTVEEAGEVLAKVTEEGADFYSIAKAYSENDEIKKQIYYGLMGGEYEAAAYGLKADEFSGIVEDSGKYYILKCLDDYNEEATKVRKEAMIREQKNEAFHRSYQAYKNEHPLTEDKEFWETLDLDICPMTEADFFKISEEILMSNSEG